MAKPARPAKDNILPQVRSLAESVAAPLGARVVDVDLVVEDGHRYLRVIVAEAGDTRIEVCEKVSRALSKELDTLDHLIPEQYFLEVSSPGVTLAGDIGMPDAPAHDASRPAKRSKPRAGPLRDRTDPGEEERS